MRYACSRPSDDNNAPRKHRASTTWEQKQHDLIWLLDDNDSKKTPRFKAEKWREVFNNQVKTTPLSLITGHGDDQLFSLPLGEQEEPFEVKLPKERIWDRFNTLSQIAMLEGDEKEVGGP